MTAMKDQLRADLSRSMKARDDARVGVLRMAISAVTNEEVAGKQARELGDDETVRVLAREAKKRHEAADAFDLAGRASQAEAERAEAAVLEEYLPRQLSGGDLAGLVTTAIEEVGATGPKAMGQVMKLVNPRVAGRAEGARVAAEVKRQLAAADTSS